MCAIKSQFYCMSLNSISGRLCKEENRGEHRDGTTSWANLCINLKTRFRSRWSHISVIVNLFLMLGRDVVNNRLRDLRHVAEAGRERRRQIYIEIDSQAW